MDKVVLAYSGGLDTSVAVKWIADKYGLEVVTLTANLGQERDLEPVRQRALKVGAVEARVVDARDMFVEQFVWPALQAGAVYEDAYYLATALGRPLISWLMVELAHEVGATAVAHGSTGKGNDQVRFDVSVMTLDPDLRIIAPIREWSMNRDQEIDYAHEHGIEIPVTKESPYSTDENLWGRSIEAGPLEDAWKEPPEEVYEWTVDAASAPDKPEYVEIEFERGIPIALDGAGMGGVELIQQLHERGGAHGVGRTDHVENRLVGIKSREIYEAPAAAILHSAHRHLETMTLSREQERFKRLVSHEYARMVYDGLWFSGLHRELSAYVQVNQANVNGTVRMKLFKGQCMVAGRKSDESLYREELATYGKNDTFDHEAAVGFIKLHGLSQQTQARLQLGAAGPTPVLPKPDSGDLE